MGGKERGYDGAKKIKGRKRHLLVDTQGLVLEARVHGAEIQDREGTFSTRLFSRYQKNEKALCLALMEMYVERSPPGKSKR